MKLKRIRIINRVLSFFSHKDWVFLAVLICIYAVTLSYFAIARHNSFSSGYDLANADQTVWNTIHGNFFSLSSKGKLLSRLTIHADFILALLSPLYLLWDNVRFLLVIQSFFLALGAIPVYLLSLHTVKNKIVSFVLVFVYLLNPGMQWTNMYDFHGIALAIPLLLFTFYFAVTKRWGWYVFFALLSILTKEEVSLIIAMMGIYIVLYVKNKKAGLLSFLFGICWFFVTVFAVMPYFRGGTEHWAFAWYHLSEPESEGDTSKTPILGVIVNRLLFAYDVPPYYFSLLKPFGIFLPLIRLPELLLSSPEIVINTLSTHAEMRGIMLHYDSGITPFLIISTIFGLGAVYDFTKKNKRLSPYSNHILYGLTVYLLFISVRVNYPNTPLPYSPNCWCRMYEVTDKDKQFEELLAKIPQDASVTSSPEIRSHVTHRVKSFTLPRYADTDTVDYIAIIDQNRLVGDYSPKEFELGLIDRLSKGHTYQLVQHIDHFYLFKKI